MPSILKNVLVRTFGRSDEGWSELPMVEADEYIPEDELNEVALRRMADRLDDVRRDLAARADNRPPS